MTYKLDKIDRRILFELDRNARIPEVHLARLTNRSKESIRYRIRKLEQNGIILGYSTWVDPTKLGYLTAKIYLNFSNIPEVKQLFIDEVTQDKRLFWLGIAEGAWNAGLTYFVKSNEEFFELKNELVSKYKHLILSSHTGMLVDVNKKDRTFLFNTDTKWKTFFDQVIPYELEDVERKILKAIFMDARLPVTKIAEKCKTSVDVVRSRLKKLEVKRIIFRYNTNINWNKLGYDFYKTFLYFKNITKQDEAKLREYCKQTPEVIHLVRQISAWDMELEIMCPTYSEYNRVISDLTIEFANIINKVETAIMGIDYIQRTEKLIFE